jgi:hypothetical protein
MPEDYGIKISKPGVDVKTAGLGDIILHSGYPTLKIKASGVGSIEYTNDGSETDILVITHNLGYVPLFFFQTEWYNLDLAEKASSYIAAPCFDGIYADLGITASYKPYATTTALRYAVNTYDGNGGTFTLNYIYVVYYDPDSAL